MGFEDLYNTGVGNQLVIMRYSWNPGVLRSKNFYLFTRHQQGNLVTMGYISSFGDLADLYEAHVQPMNIHKVVLIQKENIWWVLK